MSDEPVTPRITPDDPDLMAAVVWVVNKRVAEILTAASNRLDDEADARLRRWHDVEHVAGWREAAQWQRDEAAKL